MVTCKASVRIKRFTPALMALLNALEVCDREKADDQPMDLMITSANDSTHVLGSRHYSDEALDVRAKSFASLAAKRAFRDALLRTLPAGRFTVLHEDRGGPNEHFHLQPKKGTAFQI